MRSTVLVCFHCCDNGRIKWLEEESFIWLTFTFAFPHPNPSLRKGRARTQAGTWKQEQKQNHKRMHLSAHRCHHSYCSQCRPSNEWRKFPHRLAYQPILWRHFLNWACLFLGDPNLCQVDKNLRGTGTHSSSWMSLMKKTISFKNYVNKILCYRSAFICLLACFRWQ